MRLSTNPSGFLLSAALTGLSLTLFFDTRGAVAADAPQVASPEPTSSVFIAVIRDSVEHLQGMCNDRVPPKFDGRESVRVKGFRGESVWFSLNRGNVKLSAKDDVISSVIPFTGTGGFDGNFHPAPIGGGVGVHQRADFAGSASGTVKFHLNPDWTIGTTTTVAVAVDKAETVFHLPAGISFKVSFRQKAHDMINQRAPEIFKNVIDNAVANLDVPGQARKAWNSLHLRQKVEDAPPIWLTLRPEEVRIAPLLAKHGDLQTEISIKARTDAFISHESPEVPLATLPKAIEDPEIDNALEVALPTRVSADVLESESRKSVVGKSFKLKDGAAATVDAAGLKPVGDHVELVTSITIKRQGAVDVRKTLALRGKLSLDAKAQVLRVEDIQAMTAGDAMPPATEPAVELTNELRPQLSGTIQIRLQPLLDAATASAKRQLSNLKNPDGAELHIEVGKIEITDAGLVDGEALLTIHATGKAVIVVKPAH
jgi:hypothetical protein